MGSVRRPGRLPMLVEPTVIEPEYVTGLAAIEDMGAAAQFVLYFQHFSYEADCPVWTVRKRIIMPWEGVMPGIEMAVGVAARRAARRARHGLMHLVR